MVKFKVEIPEVPRKEIDRLEDTLDRLFYKGIDENKDRWEYGWRSSNTPGKEGPYRNIWIQYKPKKISNKPIIEIEAEGIAEQGDFKLKLDVSMPDQVYGEVEKIVSGSAPYFSKFFGKKIKVNK